MLHTTTNWRRAGQDHFEPENDLDPQAQRKLRGQLEQIDYATFASNRSTISAKLTCLKVVNFKRLAAAASEARARWVALGLELSENPQSISPEKITALKTSKTTYLELTEVYEELRRMVERGYLGCAD